MYIFLSRNTFFSPRTECPFCQRLAAEREDLDARVHENEEVSLALLRT